MKSIKLAPESAPRLLSLEEIMAAPDVKTETVDIPEWGGAVEIRGITMEQLEAVRATATVMVPGPSGAATAEIDKQTFANGLLSQCVVSPAITLAQAMELRSKAASPINKLYKAILAVCGLNEEAVKQAEKSASA